MSHDEMMAAASFWGVFKEVMFMELVMWMVFYALASLPGLLIAAGLLVRKRGPWFVPLATLEIAGPVRRDGPERCRE